MYRTIAATLLLAALPAAHAQEDVIVVTGDRQGEVREQSVLSLGVISGETIADIAPQHPAELLNREAGVFINRGNGAEHLTAIRSPVLTGGAGAGSFLYLQDGIPLRAAGFANVNGLFEDIGPLAGAVEVLRGPGPALYGSNALHGLVNTLTPDPAETSSRLVAEAGSFGRYRGDAVLARPGERVSSLLALSGRHEDGWREDARLDHVRALVRADGEARGVDWRFTASLVGLNQETAGYAPDYRDRELARANGDPEAFRDAIAGRMSLRMSGPAGGNWSWSLTPYWRANAMDFRMHFFPSDPLEKSGHRSAGLNAALVREAGDVRITLGADAEWTRGWLSETQENPTIFSFIQGDHYDYEIDAQVAALYGQARWQASDRLSLVAGARWEATRFDYDTLLPAGSEGRYLRLPDRSDDFSTFAPNIGFLFELSDNSALFGRMARGVRAPQTAELYRLQPGQTIAGIEPETLDSAELGWRRSLGEGRVEVTAFAMEKSNVFFRDADGFNVTDGATDHHGIEFDIAWPFADTLEAGLTGSWARHTYAFDRPVSAASEGIAAGNDVDTAPRWLWTGRLAWTPTPQADVALEWTHVGEYFTDAGNLHTYEGHDLLTLRARYRLSDRTTLYGAIRNLTGEAYAERADYAFGNARYFPGEPRGVTVGIRVTG
ncbi:MAG: TonB-dependent receptor [Pseudomonadota bacterium]|nr:TonB-dependent receptor [Pseudomonadota bacterium]